MPDSSVHHPHGWGDFILGNVVNDRGVRGTLYRATHKNTYARVLLKVSPSPNAPSKARIEYELVRGLSECAHILHATELAKLNLDPQATASRDAIVFEDCSDYVPVSQLLAASPKGLDLETLIAIVLPILEALHFVHSRDIIHGDVNPACMLYNPATKSAKLYDFGSSVPVSHTFSQYPPRPDGTPGFISTHPWVDTRFDVYSVGVSIYYMLSGEMPVIDGPSPSLHELAADIPMVISNIVSKAMMPDPIDRYQSIYGLMVDLRTCAEYVMLSAPIPTDITLGTRDFSTTFHCHGQAMGRDRELSTMRTILERVSSSKKSEVIALEGPPGSRKVCFLFNF
eukprot:Phypoly_transcript_11696.p1 GENE.Phypoly_transcript_11696~~Phypoly_transcript_11696.p1  ORF type:complete len:340 (+),score=30.77 Phypoly_transcript_11696:124-1143(+)